MADAAYDVFISYARADAPRARAIRDRLAALGLRAFFDAEGIDTGEEFPVIIDRAVKSAKCVLGLWSRDAFEGRWVRIESRIGLDQNKLVAATLDAMRPEELPAEFYNVNVVSLADFGGDAAHEGWSRIVRAIGKRVGRADLAGAPIVDPSAHVIPPMNARHYLAIGGAVAVLALVLWGAGRNEVGPSPAEASMSQTATAMPQTDMSGAWMGAYSEGGRETRFELNLQRGAGSAFNGSVSEPDIYGIIGGATYAAEINGAIAADGSVRFTKTYGGAASQMRAVIYEGQLSSDGRSIAGSWDTGTLHGPFHMERR